MLTLLFVWNITYAQNMIDIDDINSIDHISEWIDDVNWEYTESVDKIENFDRDEDLQTINEVEDINSKSKSNNQNEFEDIDNKSESNNQFGIWLINIHFGFCDQWINNLSDSLNAAVEQSKPTEFCMAIYNDAPIDLVLNMEYDTLWNNGLCTLDTSFEKFIENIDQIKSLVIPANETVQTSIKINFPVWIEWKIWWCVAYSIAWEDWWDDEGWLTLKTVFRNAYVMNFFVWWIDDIKNEIIFNDISTELDSNKDLNLNFTLSNEWNLEDKIEINWIITNIFWYKKNFNIEWKGIQLTPWSAVPISAVLWSIPSYGWWYKIEFTATATPFFSYDISNSSIDPTLLEAKEFSASTTFFQMPWLILIILIILILLIVTIFRKPKQKVVYVQAPQQPTPNTWYQQPQYQQPQYQQPVQPQQPQVAQPQYQQPAQPQQPQYPNNPQYGQQAPQNPQATPPQYNPNN